MANDIILIKTDLTLGSIEENFDDIKQIVKKEMEPYKGLVFADDDIKSAKNTRAMLNKLRTQIEDRRKAIKRQWNEPYTLFESKVKDVLAIIEGPIEEIDGQVKDFEERQRQEKKLSINETLDELLSKQDEYIEGMVRRCNPWFYDQKWENASVSISTVSRQMSDKIEYILQAYDALKDDPKYAGQLIGMFEETGDLTKVINYGKQLAERDRLHKEQMDAEAAKNKAAMLAAAPQTENTEPVEYPTSPGPQVIPEESAHADVAQDIQAGQDSEQKRSYHVTFSVDATFVQLKDLTDYMKSAGINFKKI